MKALILIGGEGTRLRPLTYTTLKCMVPIANRPFIEYQFAHLKKHGIREVVLSVCCMPEKIRKAVGSGKRYGVKVEYAVEKEPLGTGGAIRNSLKYLDDTTIVMNGDILTGIDLTGLLYFHKKVSAAATIALHEVKDPSAYGLVIADRQGRVRSFVEKPQKAPRGGAWINAGIYVFSREAAEMIPAGVKVSVERETFPAIIEKTGRLFCAKQEGYWLDIGTIEKYKQANFDLLAGKFPPLPGSKKPVRGILSAKGTKLAGVIVKRPLVIGKNCGIAAGSSLKNSVIWDNVSIAKGAVIEDSIIGSGSFIPAGGKIKGEVLGNGTRA